MDAVFAERYLKRGLSCFSGARRRALERFDLMGAGEGLHVTTRYHNVSVLKGFMFWLIKRGVGLEDVKVETVMEYLAGISNLRTRRSSAIIIRKFLRFLGNNDGGHFKIPRRPDDDLPDVIDEADVLRMAEVAENPCYRALVMVLYESAARNHEIRGLRIRDVSFDQYGARMVIHSTKTGDRVFRLVISVPSLQDWLEHHRDRDNPDAHVFYASDNPKISGVGTRKIIKRLARKAGIKSRVTPHILRHSRIAKLKKEKRLSDTMLIKMAGWKTRKMIDRYGRLYPTEIEDAYLQMYGLKREEEPIESGPLMPKTCPRCKTVNPPTNRYCGKCSMILDETLSLEAEQHEMRSFAEKLVSDPGFTERFLDFLSENLSVVKPDGTSVPLKTVVTPKGIMLQRPESHKS